jgi:hypothetical protein
MKINRDNYEAYFIDYIEGNLNENLVDDFLEFLQQNPDLKEELSLFQSVSLEPEEIQFNKKEELYKNKFDLEDHFNHASVAFLEGDLNKGEKEKFEGYLNSHPEKQKEFQIFQKTKLHPDLSKTFNKKGSLYHHSVGKSVVIWSVRIAAVLILALTFYVLANQYSGNKIETPELASNENELPQNEPQKKELTKKIEQEVVTPEKEVQKPEVKPENKSTKPQIAKPIQKSTKSIRENSKGRMIETDVANNRTPLEPLKPISGLMASLDVEYPQATLKTNYIASPEEPAYQEEERYFADVVIEKTGLDKLSFNKIAKTGLNIVSTISKEKLSYETNNSGKVTEINYDSRLLAFSIPTKGQLKE